MVATLMRRGLSSVTSILILTSLVFAVAELTPGGPAQTILGLHTTAEAVKALNHALGLDQPIYIQYLTWWGHLLQGNLGYSLIQHQSVVAVIGQYLGNTAVLDSVSLLLAILLSLGIGIVQGANANTWISKVISVGQFFLYAMPIFWLGIVLIYIFSVTLNWLPSGGAQDLAESNFDLVTYVRHLILPTVTLTLIFTSFFSRYMGTSARLEFQQAYVTVAVAKGAAPVRIALLHVMRNAARPLVTMVGLFLPWIFAGGVVVEEVFNFPGLGYLLWQSAIQHDYPVLIVIVMIIGLLTIIGNLLADIINSMLDVRVRYE
ncbi:MAG TPA: ABC transporter permease [Chloroflexota bacterium]|nr:ABC transporter permease [Chloroflexota bacterium]